MAPARRPQKVLGALPTAHVRELCESTCGALEGLASSEEGRAHVEKTACVLDGSPYCEMRLWWE